LKVVSLFAGIGGFDLAAEQEGWETVATCEISELPREVLITRFPKAYHHDDVKTLTYKKLNEKITKTFGTRWRADGLVLVGGFPCQPYSNAGKRLGTEDDRHLWPEMLRIISEAQPEWVIGENVRGLVSWNAGMVFEQVQADLEAQGYEVWPFLLPACAVNAPHRRDRVWFIGRKVDFNTHSHVQQRGNGNNEIIPSEGGFNALGNACKSLEDGIATHTKGIGTGIIRNKSSKEGTRYSNELLGIECGISSNDGITPHSNHWCRPCDTIQAGREIFEVLPWGQRASSNAGLFGQKVSEKQTARVEQCDKSNFADTSDKGLQRSKVNGSIRTIRKNREKQSIGYVSPNWQNFPTQSPICGGDDGLSGELVRAYVIENSGGLLTEKEVNTIVSRTIEAYRKANIQAYGNAVVPPLVRQIIKAINKFEEIINP
jgi:DNA (cytosine-5)-methyltransferase 1